MKNSLVVMIQPNYDFTAAVADSMAHTDWLLWDWGGSDTSPPTGLWGSHRL